MSAVAIDARDKGGAQAGALTYTLPVLLRYLSMGLQFATFILVTRRLSARDVGLYYETFGLVSATYFLSGFGLPDGLVKWVAHALATGDGASVRALIAQAARRTFVTSLLAVAVGVLLAWHWCPRAIVLLTAAWWLCYGQLFLASQVLVSIGKTSWGAFYFYPASSIALFAASAPYLALVQNRTIAGTLVVTTIGAAVCASAAIMTAVRYLRPLPKAVLAQSLSPVLRVGISIAVARVLQSALYWIPVWTIGATHGAANAAFMGTASRLNGGVAAIIAAIRFTIRPTIVRDAARGNWRSIARGSNQVATIASASAIVALIASVMAGPFLVRTLFGSGMTNAAPLLSILLVGTLAECVGGPVDEILKMTGSAQRVMFVLCGACGLEAILASSVGRLGGEGIAATQSLVFAAMYAYMLWYVWRVRDVYVGAVIEPRSLRDLYSRNPR